MGEKKVYSDFMIDIETLSRKPNAAVFKIGVQAFCTEKLELGPSLDLTLNLNEQILYRDFDPETISWWKKQESRAQSQLKEGTMSVDQAFVTLEEFFKQNVSNADDWRNIIKVWGNGSSFDITILESFYDELTATGAPWSFRNVFDLRTFKRFRNIETVSKLERLASDPHVAALDAQFQAEQVLHILRHTCVEPT